MQLESAEAGTRYHAPILIVPGLFHSDACWHGMMAMLAHRGWDVYLLPRLHGDRGDAGEELDWHGALDEITQASASLGDKLILFGADVGASMTLAVSERVRPMALGLFAPSIPATLGASFTSSLGFLDRRRVRKGTGPVAAPSSLASGASREVDVAPEPRGLIDDLVRGVAFEAPASPPPAIVFSPDDDPLVDHEHSLEFANNAYSKPSATRLTGRWWPATRGQDVADAVHRFLILTLSDRVVEFPDEIIDD